jgi:hypothetical protein
MEYSVTSRLPVVMIDRPGPFDTLGTWQSFLAELETMEDFQNKDIEIRTRRTFDWRMADLSWCIPSFQ